MIKGKPTHRGERASPAVMPEDELPSQNFPGRVVPGVKAGVGLKRFKIRLEPFPVGGAAEYWVARDQEEAERLFVAANGDVDVVTVELPY